MLCGARCVPDTVLGAGDSVANKVKQASAPRELMAWAGQTLKDEQGDMRWQAGTTAITHVGDRKDGWGRDGAV